MPNKAFSPVQTDREKTISEKKGRPPTDLHGKEVRRENLGVRVGIKEELSAKSFCWTTIKLVNGRK
jgi:hypothetical protein